MYIVADENIPGLEETFERFGTVVRLQGRLISSEHLRNADVLLIRSVTRADQKLLEGSSVKFLGSATIGIDHIDADFIQQAGIRFCHAPGCNADAAAQYTLSMILLAARRTGLQLPLLRAGVVGFGNVGSRLKQLLLAAGAGDVICCDPPLTDAGFQGLATMNDISQCNLVSFHVPLTESGLYPTRNLVDRPFLSALAPGTLLVNSSRGGVVDPRALADWLALGQGYAALDVWPHEPVIESGLLEKTVVGTPHVAGYSLDGKLNGTQMLFQQFQEWLGIKPDSKKLQEKYPNELLQVQAASGLADIVLSACPVERDDSMLRSCVEGRSRVSAEQFDRLRSHYPVRRDFAGIELAGSVSAALKAPLEIMGFRL